MSLCQDFLYTILDYDRVGERKIKRLLKLYKSKYRINHFLARFLNRKICEKYNCFIPYGVTMGDDLRIEHAMGIRIGATAVIGNSVRIYQNIDIMAKVSGDQERNEKGLRRHAIIGDNTVLCAGCYIIGPITIGEDCIIGARATVTHDIPPHSVVIGVNQVRAKRAGENAPTYKKR